MKRNILKAICLTLLLTSVVSVATAETIVLNSGNAAIGSPDPNTTVMGIEFGTVAAAAVALQQATVLEQHPLWVNPPGDSKWVGVAGGRYTAPYGGYVYEMHFILPTVFYVPSLTTDSRSDDGGAVYLNGHFLGGTGNAAPILLSCNDPAWFNSGSNSIQIFLENLWWQTQEWTPSGAALYAQITYSSTPVAEPSSILAAFSILAPAGLMFRRRRV